MKRYVQGTLLGVGLLSVTVGILLLANVGADKDTCTLAPSLSTVGCFLRSHKELAAGLLTLDAAIFAAWIAWVSVQLQLHYQKLLANTELEQTTDAIRFHLEDHLACLSQVWRVIDLALAETDESDQRRWVFHAESNLISLGVDGTPDVYMQRKEPFTLDQIKDLATGLPPVRRYHLVAALGHLGLIYALAAAIRARKTQGQTDDIESRLRSLSMIRESLSRMCLSLHAFDPAMDRQFAGRHKAQFDRTPTAAEWAAQIDDIQRQNAELRKSNAELQKIKDAIKEIEASEPKG
ncbi:MAG: hypothetical protein Q8M19_29355 [Reyranella sp.]|nr:hypothetical protein [Reyranella sp.]